MGQANTNENDTSVILPSSHGSSSLAPWLRHHRRCDGQPWKRVPPNPAWPRKRIEPPTARDKWWRRDAHIAIDNAVRDGELSRDQASALRSVLSFSDDTGSVVWASQQTLAISAGWSSDRTLRRHLRACEAAGWIKIEHRCTRSDDGTVRQLTNITLVTLPDAAELARASRKKPGKNRPTPKAPQNRPALPAEDRRPIPPLRSDPLAHIPVLPPLLEPRRSGAGAVLAERAMRRARGDP